jgi:Pyruvate/2-oxoacid:ferredoxin oxidoreductase delta subunit
MENTRHDRSFHSVTLDAGMCVGCINCLKRCPTEAIRVGGKKAHIKKDFCIDCGECIRNCPHHAWKAVFDPLDSFLNSDYEYKIALPPPALYAQFNNLEEKALVLNALLEFGFDDVYEVAAAAEMVSEITRKLIKEAQSPFKDKSKTKLPIISSACPSVTRLIRVKFPNLVKYISPLADPVELAANAAVTQAISKTGLPRERIGVFFITPCPAQVTEIYSPIGIGKSQVDKAIAMSDVYPKLLPLMKDIANNNREWEFPREINAAGRIGVSWGAHCGEASGLLIDNYLAVDGTENVVNVLHDLEDTRFEDFDFIELNACSGGCVGGVLTVENAFIAKVKLNALRKYLPVSGARISDSIPEFAFRDKEIEYLPIFRLGKTMEESIALMQEVDTLMRKFPGLDCGCCGAPTCRAHAEDVAKGVAKEKACLHLRILV